MAWTKSVEHQKNILNVRYEKVKLAVKTGILNGELIVVVLMRGIGGL
jgi:hypothetical protein